MCAGAMLTLVAFRVCVGEAHAKPAQVPSIHADIDYLPRKNVETSGLSAVIDIVERWPPDASLGEVARAWTAAGPRGIDRIEASLRDPKLHLIDRVRLRIFNALLHNFQGEPVNAYDELSRVRAEAQTSRSVARETLFTLIFLQGVSALQRGETDDCVMCRGPSSCILPIAREAVTSRTMPQCGCPGVLRVLRSRDRALPRPVPH